MKKMVPKLAILFVLQLILVVSLWWPKESRTIPIRGLFDGMDFEKISQIRFQDNESEVTLVKKGERWVLPDQHDFAADSKKVEELFEKLAEVKTGTFVGQTPPSHERFEVSDKKFQRKISFETSEKKGKETGFFLGSAPVFRSAHIRRLDQKEVYTTNKIADFDIPVKSMEWLQKNLMDVQSNDIFFIEFKKGKETFTFTREEKTPEKDVQEEGKENPSRVPRGPQYTWFMDGKEVNKGVFDPIVHSLAGLRLSEVLGTEGKKEYELDKPQIVVTVKFNSKETEMTKTFSVGKKEGTDYVLHFSDSEFFLKVPVYQFKSLEGAKKSELLAAKK